MSRFTAKGPKGDQGVPGNGTPTDTYDKVYATNNGNGTNFKVGDDAWIGDVNTANHISIKGDQDATKAGIILGSGKTEKIVSNATDMTLSANNDIILSPGSTYAYIGTPLQNGSNRIAKRSDIPTLYYGNFARSTNMASGGTTTANLVTWDTTNLSSGMSIDGTDASKIVFANPGIYNLNFLGQFNFTGGASNYNITTWFAKNGTNVPSSAFTFTTTSAQGSQVLANLESPISVTSNDYIQFYWWSGASGMSLIATAAGTNPTRPASPSANLTIYNVG
jgi:hypothetical protein